MGTAGMRQVFELSFFQDLYYISFLFFIAHSLIFIGNYRYFHEI